MRIVSLLPSATEIVYALGLGEDLSGVTYECDSPPEAATKPVVSRTALPQDRLLSAREIDELVGDFMERQEPIYRLDKELIQQIGPDLILAQDLCRVCAVPSGQVEDALAEIGCESTVISLDPHSLDEVIDSIEVVGRATGSETRAKEITEDLRARVECVRRAAAGLPSIRTVCLEWSDPPYTGGHWIPEMVQIAGGVNLLSEPGTDSRRVEWHEVREALPDIVLFMPCGYYLEDAEAEAQSLYRIHDFAETPAARAGEVYAVDATSYFSRPGPRLVDGLEIMAWAIHPEAFPEPPAHAIARVVG